MATNRSVADDFEIIKVQWRQHETLVISLPSELTLNCCTVCRLDKSGPASAIAPHIGTV